MLSIAAVLAGTGLLLAGIVLVHRHGSGPTVMIAVGMLLIIASHAGMRGLTPVIAGEARVVQLFGRSLRANADEITTRLSAEIARPRCAGAGGRGPMRAQPPMTLTARPPVRALLSQRRYALS